MEIVIIPGFTGYPEEVTFKDLEQTLIAKGHSVTKIAWPYFPDKLDKYSPTATIAHARTIIGNLDKDNLVILGFSMGGIIATLLAKEFGPKKLGLIVTPYQAGSEDDLAGKYKEWQQTGYRKVNSSKYGELEVPFSFVEDARQYNALELIQHVHCPTLFVAGEEDKTVPSTVSKRLFDAANEPKQWHLIPGMEHKYQYQPEMLAKVNDIVIDFIELDE